jgi:hypothetical protein
VATGLGAALAGSCESRKTPRDPRPAEPVEICPDKANRVGLARFELATP